MSVVEMEHTDLRKFFRRYIERGNAHRFSELGEFVDDDVRVNDTPHGLGRYGAGLRELIDAFPDFHRDLRHLLVYRVDRGKIVEVWGDLGPAVHDQLEGPVPD
jgi:predicted ester cyclase